MNTYLPAVEQLEITNLQLNPKNPRVHSPRQVRQIAQSISAFGFNVPVLIDSSNLVVAGHGRVLACQQLGWTHIPAIRLAHLTPDQARAFTIADNKLTDNSTWDDALLAESLRILSVADLDFSIEATGFTMGEIDFRIEGEVVNDNPAIEPEIAAVVAGPAVAKLGDLWILDRHRVICSDATMGSTYERLMQGDKANMVFTDPPFNVRVLGHVSSKTNKQHREFAMASGEMSSKEFETFLTTVCGQMARHSADGSMHFICMDWRHATEILAAGHASFTELKNICVWVKDNGGMGSLYRSRHELFFLFKNGTSPHTNNVQLGQYGRYRTNVWEYPSAQTMSRQGTDGNVLAMHPTVKPIQMVMDAIMDCSDRKHIILDPFLGSGTTLLAAERVGRICFGSELDPLYVDTIIRRWQQMTGQEAIHSESGKTFLQLEAEVMESSHE